MTEKEKSILILLKYNMYLNRLEADEMRQLVEQLLDSLQAEGLAIEMSIHDLVNKSCITYAICISSSYV